ncbi:hypothetical protein [Amycolatopsis sp. cmx-4-83]|uniref:hypothetical protein n=1 Tax=Amycolatopsis sp. cmx-4-83 TaxID=2790940 RepID=UPI0039787569
MRRCQVETITAIDFPIAIDHDSYLAEHVGRTADGRQFFMTMPFMPAAKGQGNEFVALFLSDRSGQLLEAGIDEFGPRAQLDRDRRQSRYNARMRELGQVTFTRIEAAPFAVERFGTTFGLIPRRALGAAGQPMNAVTASTTAPGCSSGMKCPASEMTAPRVSAAQ